MLDSFLLINAASGSDITSCIKIYKPLVVYCFTGNVMLTLQYIMSKDLRFYLIKNISK